jgi:DNA repair exonuclease SbcCD ATPase subunit
VDSTTVHNNPEQTNGVGGVPDPSAQDTLLAQIERLRSEAEQLRQERDTAKANYESLNTNYKELTQDLETKTLEIRQVRNAFEVEKIEWQRRVKIEGELKNEIEDLKTQLHNQKTQLQSVKKERDKLRPLEASFRELESNFKTTFDELDQRNTQLSNVEQLYDEIKIKHAAASDELNRMKLESQSMLDDAFFIRKWNDLQSDIKQWAEKYFWVEQKRTWTAQFPHSHPNINVDLLKLSDDCKDLLCLEGGSGRSIVAEAYLWRLIEEETLDGNPETYSKGFLWAHTLRSEFCRMEEFLRPGKLNYYSVMSTQHI